MITGRSDHDVAYEFIKGGDEVSDEPQSQLEIMHIIAFKQNKFDDRTISSPEIVRDDVLSFPDLTHLSGQTDAARFKFQDWFQHGRRLTLRYTR